MAKKFFNGCIICLIAFFTGCSDKNFPTGTFQQKHVTVDGDLSEWSEPLRFVSNSQTVQYNVTNDQDNIYISLETHDETTAMKILRAGINIYFDPAAGKSNDICLAFPLANASHAPAFVSRAADSTSERNDPKQLFLLEAISFKTTGFKNIENRVYDVSDKTKIKVALKTAANNGLGYEAVVPLQYIFDNAPSTKKTGHNISVGIVINALKGQDNYRDHSTAPRSGAGRRGGGHGRHMSGGNYSRNNNQPADPGMHAPERELLLKQDANWYKFKLADKR